MAMLVAISGVLHTLREDKYSAAQSVTECLQGVESAKWPFITLITWLGRNIFNEGHMTRKLS